MKKMHDGYCQEIPGFGETMIETFNYVNGRCGMIVNFEDGFSTNLTLNFEGVHESFMILKMVHIAKQVNEYLLDKTDMFEVVKHGEIGGLNYTVVRINEKCYEKE